MRRRSDSWLNATQILKVAGLDKPQRTRILERDVQKQTHEKVQGGYGKYQGACVSMTSELTAQARGSRSNAASPSRSNTASSRSWRR